MPADPTAGTPRTDISDEDAEWLRRLATDRLSLVTRGGTIFLSEHTARLILILLDRAEASGTGLDAHVEGCRLCRHWTEAIRTHAAADRTPEVLTCKAGTGYVHFNAEAQIQCLICHPELERFSGEAPHE